MAHEKRSRFNKLSALIVRTLQSISSEITKNSGVTMNKERAIKASKHGAVAAFISAGVTFALASFAILTNAEGQFSYWKDPLFYVNVILAVLLGFFMLRQSRAAAVSMFAYFLLSKISYTIETGTITGITTSLIFLYFFGKAIQGSFIYHKIRKEEDSNYKIGSKWAYYVFIPIGGIILVFYVYGILSITGIVPPTEVITGSKLTSKHISMLSEKGIINQNEKIEYFYSEGVLSILEGGSILTDNRVIVYEKEGVELKVYDILLQDIVSIDQLQQGSQFSDSIYEVQPFFDDTAIRLILSTENRGDIKFVEELKKKAANHSKYYSASKIESYEPSVIFRNNHDAIVLIRSYDASGSLVNYGSGFNVHENGLIITNLHVVLAGGSYLDIKFPKHGTYEDVYIAGFSRSSADLVVLKIDAKDLPKVNTSKSSPVEVGDRIYTISTPEGLLNTLSEGLVSAERIFDNTKFYQITAPISEGSSGGAVFNQYGEVIGVASFMHKDGQNLNFAVCIDEIREIEPLEDLLALEDIMSLLESTNGVR